MRVSKDKEIRGSFESVKEGQKQSLGQLKSNSQIYEDKNDIQSVEIQGKSVALAEDSLDSNVQQNPDLPVRKLVTQENSVNIGDHKYQSVLEYNPIVYGNGSTLAEETLDSWKINHTDLLVKDVESRFCETPDRTDCDRTIQAAEKSIGDGPIFIKKSNEFASSNTRSLARAKREESQSINDVTPVTSQI